MTAEGLKAGMTAEGLMAGNTAEGLKAGMTNFNHGPDPGPA